MIEGYELLEVTEGDVEVLKEAVIEMARYIGEHRYPNRYYIRDEVVADVLNEFGIKTNK